MQCAQTIFQDCTKLVRVIFLLIFIPVNTVVDSLKSLKLNWWP